MHHHENPYAGQGPVLLDIGDTVGALVVEMPAAMEGAEVEIIDVTDLTERHRPPRHVAVVARPLAGRGPGGQGGTAYTLVYPDLDEGRYALHVLPDGPIALVAEVVGGQVTTSVWSGRSGAPTRKR